eukprot:TRINITY_DN63521_c0_g1_i1.p1 TRINITY_DN63521_c0_g1~~TRINITY_DN63521_c0_g1_i1.p1  ORF type:complete len:611 (-),score=80.76 TRINITY_DN63521_c0_g1_i1:166-1998(-)
MATQIRNSYLKLGKLSLCLLAATTCSAAESSSPQIESEVARALRKEILAARGVLDIGNAPGMAKSFDALRAELTQSLDRMEALLPASAEPKDQAVSNETCDLNLDTSTPDHSEAWWEEGANISLAQLWAPRDEGEFLPSLGSDVVDVEQQCADGPGKVLSSMLSVEKALAVPAVRRGSSRAFVMRNGENQGVFVAYRTGCHLSVAKGAAQALGATRRDISRPMRLFTPSGRPVDDHSQTDVLEHTDGLLHVLLEGEVWVWPGVRPGLQWSAAGAQLETFSLSPRVILVRNITWSSYFQTLKQKGERMLTDNAKDYGKVRTSWMANLPPSRIKEAFYLREKMQHLVRLPEANFIESPQLLRYRPPSEGREFGEWYKRHYDLKPNYKEVKETKVDRFIRWIRKRTSRIEIPRPVMIPADRWLEASPADRAQLVTCQALVDSKKLEKRKEDWLKKNIAIASHELLSVLLEADESLLPKAHSAYRRALNDTEKWRDRPSDKPRFVQPNRHATMLIYVNSVTKGGETVFPDAETSDPEMPRRVRPGLPECEKGLAVVPNGSEAMFFYSQHGNGTHDLLSAHIACPPLQGEKWAMNVFMWNVPHYDGLKHYNSRPR